MSNETETARAFDRTYNEGIAVVAREILKASPATETFIRSFAMVMFVEGAKYAVGRCKAAGH